MADVQHYIDEAVGFYQASDFARAADSLESAVTEDPRNWQAWRLLGFVLNAKGDFERATKAFERAIDVNNKDVDNFFGLAMAWKGLGDLQKSVIAFEKAFHEDSHHAPSRAEAAAIYEARGEELEAELNLLGAEQYYEKAYRLSHSEEHYNRLLKYYERSGQGDKSMAVEHEWRQRHGIAEPQNQGVGGVTPPPVQE